MFFEILQIRFKMQYICVNMKKLYPLILFLFTNYFLQAQSYQVEMVSNLSINSGSNPRWLTECNGNLFFFANDGVNGHKIFSVTGNNIPVLCPNVAGAAVFGDGATSTNLPMGVYNNSLYIPILALQIGRELFKYDGINTPTMVMDINPGNGTSAPTFMTTYNNKIYFQANNPTVGTELWVHDPVAITTQCLTDINPGPLSSSISMITVYNNKLYFAGSNGNDTILGNTGIELYCYDPALNVVSLISDINPGWLASNPTALMVANNKLYFVATEPVYGKELYEYDGVNVTRLTDVNPGPAQGLYTSDQSFPTYYNGKIYFCANEPNNDMNLGVYDVTNNTTSIIYCSGIGVSGTPRYFKVWDNKLFFSNHSDTTGTEIWATNGVTPPFQVWDVYPGSQGGFPYTSYPKFFTSYNGSLYFNASNDTSSGEELFRLYKKVDTIVNPNAISDISNEIEIELSPNPVQDVLTLKVITKSELSFSYQIVDILGRILLQSPLKSYPKAIPATATIDCANLPSGNYVVVLKDRNNAVFYHEKLMKK